MTLENTVLEKLTEWRPPEGRQTLIAQDAGWQAEVTAERRDDTGCLLWEVAVRRQNRAESGDVRAWADRIAGRTAGLLETLRVIEVDAVSHDGLLRSDTPAHKGEDLFYYEVRLRGTNEAVLRRFKGATAANHREQTTFSLTHEVIARLTGTLAGEK